MNKLKVLLPIGYSIIIFYICRWWIHKTNATATQEVLLSETLFMSGIFIILVSGLLMFNGVMPSSGFSGFSISRAGAHNPMNHMNNVIHTEEVLSKMKTKKTYTTYNKAVDLLVSGYKIFGVLIGLVLIIVSLSI